MVQEIKNNDAMKLKNQHPLTSSSELCSETSSAVSSPSAIYPLLSPSHRATVSPMIAPNSP